MVTSNGRIYCAIPIDQDSSHPMDDILKKRPNHNVQQDAKIIQFKPWDKEAKIIDRYAMVLMPILFLIVAVIYWSSYLYMG